MSKRILLFFILAILFLFPVFASPVLAQDSSEQILKAKVIEVLESGENEAGSPYQNVSLMVLDGDQKGETITVKHGEVLTINDSQLVKKGETVVFNKLTTPEGKFEYQIIDKYRLDIILYIALVFFVLVIVLSGLKGIGSILGMIVSLFVVVGFIVPQILGGADPLLISILGSLVILVTSIYLAHGFSKQTSIAVAATFITLTIAGLLSVIFVNISRLTGLGNEDAFSLQFGTTANINFKGLLLGGMIIGFLGVLDDVTTGLAATVFEINHHSPKLTMAELVKSSLNVGREHISSLVNTLVLAYAGASLPIFIYIVLNPQNVPLWFIVNSEVIAEEIIRTLAGSMGLLFAVPITTFLAAYWLKKSPKTI